MAGSFDYTEFDRMAKNFNRIYNDFDTWLMNFLLLEGERFIARVKPRTPVDTGDLRNHWQLDGITREGDTLKCWFINSMHYASWVEYGHATPYHAGAIEGGTDWVQGYFMMTVSLDDIYRQMPARFNTAFRRYMSSRGL